MEDEQKRIGQTQAYLENLLLQTAQAENTTLCEVRECLTAMIADLRNSDDPETRAFWQLFREDMTPEELLACVAQLYFLQKMNNHDNNGESLCNPKP